MAEPIRLIVLDMDGTLLYGSCLQIPPANAAALHEAAQRGIHLALCSGRMPDDAGLFAMHAGLAMHILALNGACMLDRPLDAVRRSELLPFSLLEKLVPLLLGEGLCLGLFREHELLVTHPPETDELLTRIWGTHVLSPEGRCRVHRGMTALENFIARGVNKIVVLDQQSAGVLPGMKDALLRAFPEIEISSSWRDNLEINLRGVNKGTAVTALAAALGVPMAQVLTIGDNDNDVPMLRCAGYGVAMAGATPAARGAAGYITLPAEENGVAAAIRALALGEDISGVCRR